ncbi:MULTISPECIES: Rha family transcriptional regulator [Campylobacter]|uniref:Rha family transcriptional regulator n=1 Tax=Campylobacter TaxID=194 RepID=UPI0012CD7278|nr:MULTISPECIES: Rha family transcriptional regulator [Campylobacter]ECK7976686.1 Rha family transcriptional regulator [Campylobacter coli]ECQ5824436.1 Rha family transcriptional regulator [Campylobacter coli]MBR8636856.1 Rha family transcriptional regulator [Campylobacter coli]MCE7085968.1 Rha family transcriptional regulator [Campylobacter coli]MCE7091424.1 Rha family transcriptional regulator [Campylobacter coli]
MSALIPINNVNVVFEVVGDEIFANSLQIAEVFEKDHSNVLKAIDKLPNDEFKSSNFKYDSYFDKKSEQRRMINLTRDAFSLLVMGFTGEKAYKWKILFIKAFNEMEKRLRNIEYEKHDKLAFRQSLGYKSQLKQQKEKYENKIKALKYDLENKKELSFKRKLSKEELLELRKILARDYGILCIKEWEMSLVAEKIGKNLVFETVLNKLEKELNYWQNYEEYEEKWRKILRR